MRDAEDLNKQHITHAWELSGHCWILLLNVGFFDCGCGCLSLFEFILQYSGAFPHSCCCRRENMTLTQLQSMIKGCHWHGCANNSPHRNSGSQLYLRVSLYSAMVSNHSRSGLAGIKSWCQTGEAPCRVDRAGGRSEGREGCLDMIDGC